MSQNVSQSIYKCANQNHINDESSKDINLSPSNLGKIEDIK